MRVIPWTVDDRGTMTALLDLGVDGIITNRPDLLRPILSEYGYQPAAARLMVSAPTSDRPTWRT
jgi:hypothetical protein